MADTHLTHTVGWHTHEARGTHRPVVSSECVSSGLSGCCCCKGPHSCTIRVRAGVKSGSVEGYAHVVLPSMTCYLLLHRIVAYQWGVLLCVALSVVRWCWEGVGHLGVLVQSVCLCC